LRWEKKVFKNKKINSFSFEMEEIFLDKVSCVYACVCVTLTKSLLKKDDFLLVSSD